RNRTDHSARPLTRSASMTAVEIAGLRLPAFPCRRDKAPACPRGFHDATADPIESRELWQRKPGPLVRVPPADGTGFDGFHAGAPRPPEAAEWWSRHLPRLAPTRAPRTRSGGLHLLFQHASGLRCSAGKIAAGIDVRADGGYVIWWPAAGQPVLHD